MAYVLSFLEKIILFSRVAFLRAIMPINILLILALSEDKNNIDNFSLFVALVQIISNIDFGINAQLLSTRRIGDDSKIFVFFKYYLRKYALWKFLFASNASVFLFLFIDESKYALITLMATLGADFFIFFNLTISGAISEGRNKLAFSLIFLFFTMEFLLFFVNAFLGSDFWPSDMHGFYPLLLFLLSISIAVIIVWITFFESKDLTDENYSLNEDSFRLQISQITSSIILNKDYILLSLFSLTSQAVAFAMIARIMLIPIQLNSVFISRIWVDIANNGIFLSKFRIDLRNIIITTAVLGGGVSMICVYFYGVKYLPLILILLCFIICNACSGVSSAYCTVDRLAIPKVSWYINSTIMVIICSVIIYYINIWELSLIISCVYFIFLSKRSLRDISWN
ncbi:hypothetical protein ICR46_002603 [Vibrio cholerae]|nr:hypothetical protein [Vibrio cholerae]BCN21642.1 putative O-antigen flippase [Vibrio cholerae]GIA03947.1 hypothetical protein VCSRO83_2695 [Vibrio cholerae]